MKKYNLLVIAHPDDETLFFGGLLQSYRRRPWKIVCVTDGNADGEGPKRAFDLANAAKLLRVNALEQWNFPDQFSKRLDLPELLARLALEKPSEVFTHGILGEYGHPHHQDVSMAVHRQFAGNSIVWSCAYNAFAEKIIRLNRKSYQKKCEILSDIYFSQTHKFARWLPCQNFEGFNQVTVKEVEAVYRYLVQGEFPKPEELKVYAWFAPYLNDFRKQILERKF